MGAKNSKLDPATNLHPNIIFNDDAETFHGRSFAGSDQWEGLGLLYKYSCENGSFTTTDAKKMVNKMHDILNKNQYLMGRIVYSTDPKIKPKRYQLEMHPKNLNSENYVFEKQDEFVLNQKNSDSAKLLEKRNEHTRKNYMAKIISECCKKYTPLTYFYLFRDGATYETSTTIGILFTFNHILGDGATMYNLINMMDEYTEAYSLDPIRVSYLDEMINTTKMTTPDDKVMMDAVMNVYMKTIFKQAFYRWLKSGKYKIVMGLYTLNEDEIQRIKQEHNDKVDKKCPYITANDIMTTWLTSKNSKATMLGMPVNLRKRFKCLRDDLAGNYLDFTMFRGEDLKSPENFRLAVNTMFAGKGVSEVPTQQESDAAHFGFHTNWTSFYKPIRFSNLKMINASPVFEGLRRILWMPMPINDGLITFKSKDDETTMLILSGTGRITESMLDNDPLLKEKQYFCTY